MMIYSYRPEGVCSNKITFEVINDKITNVIFTGGCPGNLIGLSQLVEGMNIHEAVKRLKGIECGGKSTSCPDQFAKALEQLVLNK